MKWHYSQGWLLLEVALASVLLVVAVLSSSVWLHRQALRLQQARERVLAERFLLNGLEQLPLQSDWHGPRWQAWLSQSHERLPTLVVKAYCALEVCTVCYYQPPAATPWLCRSAARPVSVSLS